MERVKKKRTKQMFLFTSVSSAKFMQVKKKSSADIYFSIPTSSTSNIRVENGLI